MAKWIVNTRPTEGKRNSPSFFLHISDVLSVWHVRSQNDNLFQIIPAAGDQALLRWPPRSPDLTPCDFSLWGLVKAQRWGGGIAPNFSLPGTTRKMASTTLRPLYHRKYPVPLVQEAGWAPGQVWTGAKISLPPRFDPRTVQPVASPCMDYAIPLTCLSRDISIS